MQKLYSTSYPKDRTMNNYGCRTLTGAEFEKAAKTCQPPENIYKSFVPRPHGRECGGIIGRHEDKTNLREK